MSEVINGVPRELLERAERNLCSGEEAYRTQQDLRAVLTAQPQASAAQSAPAGEREAFEAAVAAVNERGWTTSTDLARQIWDSRAAWQRSQSAPVVPEYTSAMGEAAQKYIDECCRGSDGQLLIVPPGMPGGFYWYELYARMLAAAPQPAPREWPVVHTSVGCIACEGSPAGDNNPCHICGATQPAARQEQGDEDLRRDAERYRWLRNPDRMPHDDPFGHLIVGQAEGEDILWRDALDRQIDLDMAASAEGKA